MRSNVIALAVLLCGCGGGSSAPGAAPTAAEKPPATAPADQMPPPGDPLWSIPPDRSPLWQEIGPAPKKA